MADDTPTRDAALKESYAEATKALRQAHRDEFNDLRANHMKRLGFEWTPQPTEEELAEQQMAALLTRFPRLAEQIAQSGGGRRAAETPSA